MYPNDSKALWPGDLLPDPRFAHRWDESKAIGRYFLGHLSALHHRAGAGTLRTDVDTLWDAYLLFDAKATWTGAMPDGLVSWGSTIMQARDRLAADLRAVGALPARPR